MKNNFKKNFKEILKISKNFNQSMITGILEEKIDNYNQKTTVVFDTSKQPVKRIIKRK